MKRQFTDCKDLYQKIHNEISKAKSDETFLNPISKSDYKIRKSIRKQEKEQNNIINTTPKTSYMDKETKMSLSFDDKFENSKEIKIFKFRQNYDWIRKDIQRTFHDEEFKKIDGEEKISRILEAISFIIDEIGYVQGMNFIAGALLVLFKNEEEAFFVFYVFLKRYDLIHLYKKVILINNRNIYNNNNLIYNYK